MSRTTPTSADLMPEVLKLLKHRKELKKDAIAAHIRNWITQHGFDDRDRSIGWALNRLEKEGYVAHPRTGIWRISEKGLSAMITPAQAREIMDRWTERERADRKRRRSQPELV